MLDIKYIRQNPDLFSKAMTDRGVQVDSKKILTLDTTHKEALSELEHARAEQNKVSAGPKSSEEISHLKTLKERIKTLEERERGFGEELNAMLSHFPNIPLEDTPVGDDSFANVLVREIGKKPKFTFQPKHYMDIAEKLGIIDVKTAGKVSGTRFGYLVGAAALLEFALIQFALSRITDDSFINKLIKKQKLDVSLKAFVPVIPPVLIRPEMMRAMGFAERAGIPRGTDEIYYLDKDELYLVGTSEQSLGPMHYDTILKDGDAPIRYVGFSTCFRRESGASGKDTRGILRVHQFDKLEMFTVCKPETSRHEHLLLLAIQEALMQELKLPYRVMRLCTADMGAASAETYDIETWMPGQNEYRETHSTSNTTDYQSRALKSRYRDENGSIAMTHMLNGTVFSQRPIIAIIENNQTAKGTVIVPQALRKYMGGLREIR